MTLEGFSASVFLYIMSYEEYMTEQGFENPKKRKQFFYNKASTRKQHVSGGYSVSFDSELYNQLQRDYEGKALSPDRKYISLEEWNKKEIEYVAKSLLLEDSYDDFEKYVNIHKADYLLDMYTPCQDPTHQCSMFCHKWKGDNSCHN